MAYLISDFISDVRRSAMLPSGSSSTGTADADIVLQADKELQTRLVPLILKTRQEYFVCDQEFPTIVSCNRYKIPRRAIASRIRDLVLRRSDNTLVNLLRMEPEEAARQYKVGQSGTPEAFVVRGGEVFVYPAPTTTADFLRFSFYARPGRLQTTTAAAGTNYSLITSIAAVSTNWEITVPAANGLTAVTTASGTKVDIVSANSGFEIRAVDLTPTANTTATKYTVAKSGAPLDLDVATFANEYVVIADTAVFIPLPVEFHGVLVAATVYRMLLSLGYQDEASQAKADLDDLESRIMSLVADRVDGEPRKVTGGVLSLQRRSFPWLWR